MLGLTFSEDAMHHLAGVEPTLAMDELDALSDICTDARVVGLGEPTHGQKEINQLRDRITRYLISHLGFRIVAMEDSAIKIKLVNDYVLHAKGTAREALSQQKYWTWRTEESLALIEWMRSWNSCHPNDAVQIIGADIQDLATPATFLKSILNGDEFTIALDTLGNIQLWDPGDIQQDHTYNALDDLQEIWQKIVDDRNLTEESRALGLDSVLSLQQSFQLWRAIRDANGQATAKRWNARETAMASRVMAPLDLNQQVIVWAQNGHIQFDELDGLPPGAVTMGQILKQNSKNGYVAISGVFGNGSYRAYDLELGELGIKNVGEPPVDSLDHALWSISSATATLVTSLGANESLKHEQLTRWAGAEMVPSSEMITHVVPAKGSDAIAFVREATPSIPLQIWSEPRTRL